MRRKNRGEHIATGPASVAEAPPAPPRFPIVGIGASAGGLEAFTQLLKELPANSGMAFVLIQHLDPSHVSLLGAVLGKSTPMPVGEAQHGQQILPNHVYVIPASSDLSIEGGHLLLLPRLDGAPRVHLPIDSFFMALAAERGKQAIGVVLSGTASDGTEGLKAIKVAGGITFVQDPDTAKFRGMPSNAIAAGVVDYSLPIRALVKEMVRLSTHPYLAALPPSAATVSGQSSQPPAQPAAGQPEDDAPPDDDGDGALALTKIMTLLQSRVGVDFREYKAATFQRRLARRMALRRVADRNAYLQLLGHDPEEVRALYEDTLIHVSSFFRDPEVFEALTASVFPALAKQKSDGTPIRIWVAGCSTGEEVYSLAICLLESLEDARHPPLVQIFGSDVSELAVRTARAGKYSHSAMTSVSDERKRRFFTEVDTGFRVHKNVRDLCVFVRHDLARDPPFSQVDLLSCRNVLIYFDQALQKRVLPMFHYSLNQPGFLLLGRTENISGFSQLFDPIDQASKIFARTAAPSGLSFASRAERSPLGLQPRFAKVVEGAPLAYQIGHRLNNLLLARYAPPGVLINEKLDILQFCGHTGAFLQPAPGLPQNNLAKMTRRGLLSQVRAALTQAKKEMAPAYAVGVEVEHEGSIKTCDITVLPLTELPQAAEPLYVVLFEESAPRGGPKGRATAPTGSRRKSTGTGTTVPKLEHELSATTDYLNSLIEEHSRTNDDLGSANEELVSGNEELQSLNEELETAKEELQSTNEELTTVNDELHHRNLEVGQINSDLINLLDAVDIPIVILDKQRRIRRFTPKASHILTMLPSDVGRPFDDIRPKLIAPDLDAQIGEVISTFKAQESEVQDREGRWYRMQIRPYRAADESFDGVVLSLFDIDVLKHHVRQAERDKEEAERADRAKDEFLAVLSHELRTPLTAMVMQAYLLRRSGSDTARLERACDGIERSIKIQTQLIDDLLDVSRIVTGKLRIEFERVDLAAVIQGVVDGVGGLAESKSIALRTFLGPLSAPVSGDRARLGQVISNLLVNAIKFTPAGGQVDVFLDEEDGQAHLKVTDNGIGIEPDFLPRVFDRLIQKDSSSTRPHAGLGLGLAIVHHLVDAHGGTIRAESGGLGRGATFHLAIPLVAEQETTRRPALVQPSRGSQPGTEADRRLMGRKVLVIEDDSEISGVLAEILTDVGAAVWTAESAAAGLKAFPVVKPDVLLCDIAMPGEDGYSFIGRIRALGKANGGDIPAMALTARATDKDRQQALAGGFQMYLPKPVEVDHFVDAVAALLDWPRGLPAPSVS